MTKVKSVISLCAMLATLAIAGCEQAEEKQRNFKQLTEKVKDQVSHDILGEPTEIDYLQQASIEDRAVAGQLSAPVEIADTTLEEALRTESYFVVGSVIAKPKVQMTSIVEEEAIESSDIPEPVMSTEEFDAIEEAAPEAVEDLQPQEMQTAPGGGIRLTEKAREKIKRAVKEGEGIKKPEIRKQVMRKLERAPLSNQVAEAVPPSAQMPAPEKGVAEIKQGIKAHHKKMRLRKELNLAAAQKERSRAIDRLEKLGLSGAAYARDGGNMVINIGIEPTKFRTESKLDLDRKFKRFAPKKLKDVGQRHDCNASETRRMMKSDAELATRCVVEDLQASGDYEYVEPDYIFTNQFERRPSNLPVETIGTSKSINPNDPLWSLQWHFRNQGSDAEKSEGGAGFEDFWSRANQTGSSGVTVAVIDTGLQMDHPDIKNSRNLAPGFDMVSDPFMGNDGDGRDADPNDPGDACDPSDPLSQDSFHGTHVAGTVGVAATNNASGVAGGAWNVTIVPVRALGRCGGQLSDINDAIRWAAGVVPARDDLGAEIWNANPADVINLSIGLFERCPASMQEAINDATAAGSIVVAAAGNARIDTQYYAPGGCQNVVSVAASDARGQLTPYSNYGANVDLMAPGGDLTRDDNKDGRPDGVLSTKFSKGCYDPVTNDPVAECFYAYESGTSMAAPHVSAALALLKSQFPLATAEDLTTRLKVATNTRDQLQCTGKCSHYPGSTPIQGQDGMCYRPCGGAILNLENAQLE